MDGSEPHSDANALEAKMERCGTKEMINPVNLPACYLFGPAVVVLIGVRRGWSGADARAHVASTSHAPPHPSKLGLASQLESAISTKVRQIPPVIRLSHPIVGPKSQLESAISHPIRIYRFGQHSRGSHTGWFSALLLQRLTPSGRCFLPRQVPGQRRLDRRPSDRAGPHKHGL